MVTTISKNISQVRKTTERQSSGRETKLAELMRRYVHAREHKNRALEEVRSLYHSLREKGDSATAKLKTQYKQATIKLTEAQQLANRSHVELIDALVRGFADQYSDRRAAS
jgi:tyrosyl-tRNA synthetase